MAATTMTTAELLTMAKPWLRVLKTSTEIIDYPDDPSEIFYIHVETFDSGFDQELKPDYRALEALQVLALLGEIDYEAWKQAIAAAWPEDAVDVVRLSKGRALQLGGSLVFHHDVTDYEICPINEWCECLIESRTPSAGSRGYASVRQRLEAAYAAVERDEGSGFRSVLSRDELVVPVRIVVHEGEYIQRLLKLLEVIARVELPQVPARGRPIRNADCKPLLRLVEVLPGYSDDGPLTMKEFLCLAQIARHGVGVYQFSLDGFDFGEKNAANVLVGLQLLMQTANSSMDQSPGSSVHKVEISRGMSRRAASAVYSALQTSQSVKTAQVSRRSSRDRRSIVEQRDDRDFEWQCMVLALFSGQATHQLSKIQLWVDDMQMQDMNAVREMVNHPDPLAVILGHELIGEMTHGSVEFVTASTFLLPPSSSNDASSEDVTLRLPPQEVRLLHQSPSGKLLSVLLPGRGLAWVRSSDCSERRTHHVNGFGSKTIDEVQLFSMNDQSKDAVLALLQLVGRGIKSINLDMMKCTESMDAWFVSVLEACPQLEKLAIGGKFSSLEVFSSAFERGLCRLSSLHLSQVELLDSTRVIAFFDKLADRDHPMTRLLRSFSVGSKGWIDPPEILHSTLTSVLKANRTLQRFFFNLSYRDVTAFGDLAKYKIAEDDVTPIAKRSEPLEMRKKLAFLSATTHRFTGSDAATPTVTQSLDNRAISLIFQLAAECETRSVHVAFDGGAYRYERRDDDAADDLGGGDDVDSDDNDDDDDEYDY